MAWVAKLGDCGALGWAWKDSESTLCHLEYPMEKFLWHFVLRDGKFQSARAETTLQELG